MSINHLITDARLGAFMARARRFYVDAGSPSQDHLRRCLDLTVRYCLNTYNAGLDHLPDAFFHAVLAIASRYLPRFIATGGPPQSPTDLPTTPSTSSTAYWTDKVAIATGLDAWLDNSLRKWYLDLQHPFTDILVQTCRKHVTRHITASIDRATPLDSQAIIDSITADLYRRFPALQRFSRHLPAAINGLIETDILGTPLVDEHHVESTPMPAIAPAYNPVTPLISAARESPPRARATATGESITTSTTRTTPAASTTGTPAPPSTTHHQGVETHP